MDQLKKEHFLKILKKYQAGDATSEEINFLNAYYDAFDLRKDYTSSLEDTDRIELKKVLYQKLQSHIATGKPQISVFKLSRYWYRIAAAAIVLIFFSAGLLIYHNHQSDKNQQSAKNIIKPGGNKAILTLSNGQKISLTDALNGQVAVQKGIKITKTADGQLVYEATDNTANDNSDPQYNTVEAPAGGQWQVKLPDGSLVFLNALSSITYPTRFIGNERKIALKGEAYFEIAHNKAMPFRVTSQAQMVEVLGTHFDVMAYADEKMMKTTLLEGSVKISDHEQTIILTPGQQAQVSQSGISITDNVDLEDVIAWKNGYFKFNENIESIMSKIARWYNVDVVYQLKPDPELTFSGKISRARNLSAILKMLEFNGDVHFKVEGRRITVTK
jgi:transmembrane sensor